MKEEERSYLSRQLIKLGDMMGDGLHYEDASISREYRKIAKLLYPEIYARGLRKNRKPSQKFIRTLKPCSCCGHTSFKMRTTPLGINIFCPNCKCNTDGNLHPSKELARDAWNNLTP